MVVCVLSIKTLVCRPVVSISFRILLVIMLLNLSMFPVLWAPSVFNCICTAQPKATYQPLVSCHVADVRFSPFLSWTA